MALTIDDINAVSKKYFNKAIKQQAYQKSPFWVKLQKMGKIKANGGTQIHIPLRHASFGKADAVAARQQVTFETKETRTAAILDWKYYTVPQQFAWDEDVKNSGSGRIVSLLKDKSDEMRQDMEDRFATDQYTANPNGNGIVPLTTIVDAGDTYAGIAVADAANWKSFSEDTSTTELTLYGTGSLSEAIADCTFGTDYPNFHLTTIDLASKFESLVEPQKRYADKEMADAGFRNCTFHGAPVFGDYHCIAKLWLGLAIDCFGIAVHPKYNMKLTDWFDLTPSGHPNALGRVMSWTGEITCDCRRPNFKFTVLDYTL
jgi:hypothetical protein